MFMQPIKEATWSGVSPDCNAIIIHKHYLLQPGKKILNNINYKNEK